jgi:hypothetical protein
MVLPVYPPNLLTIASIDWNLLGTWVTGGRTGAGAIPVTDFSGGGFWVAAIGGILLRDLDAVRAYRAFRMTARGGSPFTMWRRDVIQPWPFDGDGNPVKTYGDIPFEDGAPFSDDSFFGQEVIRVATEAAADLRATEMTVSITYGSEFRGGEAFSIQHPTYDWRMYEIEEVFDAGANYTIRFSPPLREAVPDNTQLFFDLPRCTMMAASQSSFLFRLGPAPYPPQSIELIEAFPPFLP